MKITERQAFVLLLTAKDTLAFAGDRFFSFDLETRRRIVNEVTNQTSTELVELPVELK